MSDTDDQAAFKAQPLTAEEIERRTRIGRVRQEFRQRTLDGYRAWLAAGQPRRPHMTEEDHGSDLSSG